MLGEGCVLQNNNSIYGGAVYNQGGNVTLDGGVIKNCNAYYSGSAGSSSGNGGAINIQMGKFFENMVFNGGFSENAKEIERKMEECVLKVLYSAQNAG